MEKIHVYGIEFSLPEPPPRGKIENANLPPLKQKFTRVQIPEFFDDLDFDDDGDPLYTDEMIAFIERELERIDNGYWFYNRDVLTYITGEHYFYLNYWTLENDEKPDYRDADRKWFYFKQYCEQQSNIDGIIRAKKRREGATSQATASLVRTALRQRKAFCGIISKTGKDAKDTFLKMVKNGFEQLPIFLKPTNIEDPDSQTQLVFRAPKARSSRRIKEKRTRGKVFDDDKGIGSRIDYRNTELNSYDSGRVTEVLVDEGGKFPTDVPVNTYWPILRHTLRQGGKKVGFALMPSTANKLSKGGRGFKVLWDESNQFDSKLTATGLYRYFCPADEGYVPFIDEYGYSITKTPTREQAKWMREYYGADETMCSMSAREYILYNRGLIRNSNALNEEVRMNPLSEKEAFDFDDNTNIYNVAAVRDQRERILEVRPIRRQIRFVRDHEGKATWVDDPDGLWHVLEHGFPAEHKQNATVDDLVYNRKKPGNTHEFVLVADPYKNEFVTGPGSRAGGFVMSKFNPTDPENTGMPVAMYWGRPKRKRMFHEQMLLAAEFWGCYIAYESDIDDYLTYLEGENKMAYAMPKPKNVIDPNRKRKMVMGKEYGVKAGDKFSMSMLLEKSVEYVDFHCGKIWFDELLQQLEEYDVDERTLYDLVAAFQVGCVVIADPIKRKADAPEKKVPMVKTYKIDVK